MQRQKHKSFFSYIGCFLVTVIALFTAVIVGSAVYAKVSQTLPQALGYSISEIKSGSMKESGFNVGDYVVAGYAKEGHIFVGDIIVYYRHSKDKKPILKGEDRQDMEAIFHYVVEVSEVDGVTYYRARGTSNTEADSFLVPYESVAGKYVPLYKWMEKTLGIALSGNAFIYWIALLAAIIIIGELINLSKTLAEMSVAQKVQKGQIPLIDKRCFECNAFKHLSKKQKQKQLNAAPFGMSLIYEHLLYGKLSDSPHSLIAQKLGGKRRSYMDAAALTYSQESGSAIIADEYIKHLPERNKRFEKYQTGADYRRAKRQGLGMLWVVSVAFALFFGGCIAVEYMQGRLFSMGAYYLVALIAVPSAMLILAVVLSIIASIRLNESKYYMRFEINLPERYNVFINPTKLSDDQFATHYKIILAKVAEGLSKTKADWYDVYVPGFVADEFKPERVKLEIIEEEPIVEDESLKLIETIEEGEPSVENTECEPDVGIIEQNSLFVQNAEIKSMETQDDFFDTMRGIEYLERAGEMTDMRAKIKDLELTIFKMASSQAEWLCMTQNMQSDRMEENREEEIEAAEREIDISFEHSQKSEEFQADEDILEEKESEEVENMENVGDNLKIFAIRKKTFEELRGELGSEGIERYSALKAKTMSIPKAQSKLKTNYENIKSGNRLIAKFFIKRGFLNVGFELENDAVRQFGNLDKSIIRMQKTVIILSDNERFVAAMEMIDVVKSQMARAAAEKKELQKRLRRERAERKKIESMTLLDERQI